MLTYAQADALLSPAERGSAELVENGIPSVINSGFLPMIRASSAYQRWAPNLRVRTARQRIGRAVLDYYAENPVQAPRSTADVLDVK